ncbi:RNA methyltransferase [Candidatus Woesearchaeota archaeon]|nr:RNA methyltransferase [Candidatus Woesearchaeota archaeon]
MIHIALIQPETPGNLGAIARAMKNFDLSKLILIDPQCNHLSSEAIARSKHAKELLQTAKIAKSFSYLKKFDCIIGTTAIHGTDYNMPRVALSPEQLAKNIKNIKNNVVIVFGREGDGLTNTEIKKCDITVRIPTSEIYPTMNISHAASTIFYELFKTKKTKEIELASAKDKEVLLKRIDYFLNKFTFTTKEKKETQKIAWKKVLNKSFLTKREIFALFGFFRKLK